MRTHRGINMAGVAGEGLAGLAGVLVVVFFLSAGSAFLLKLFAPRFFWSASSWLLYAYLLVGAALCGLYLLSQWRDRRLAARVQAELHKLNERNGVALPDTDDAIDEFTRTWEGKLGFEEFRAEQLQAAARPRHISPVSPEGLFIAALVLLFVVSMASALISTPDDFWAVVVVAAIPVGASLGIVVKRVGVRLGARWPRREPNARN